MHKFGILAGISAIFVAGINLAPYAMASSPPQRLKLAGASAQLQVTVSPNSGIYAVTFMPFHWSFSGAVGSPITQAKVQSGMDANGPWQEVAFTWPGKQANQAFIRCYSKKPMVEFNLDIHGPAHTPFPVFPAFTRSPVRLLHFSFANHVFYPHVFKLAATATPWILFDNHFHTAVISPLHGFMTNAMIGNGQSLIGQTVGRRVRLREGTLRLATIMIFGRGIENTFSQWGRALTTSFHRPHTANNAGALLKYLGYWTDNGAAYYYHFDKAIGYIGTLLALKKQFASEHIPLHYIQLDSWWYQKSNRSVSGRPLGAMNDKIAQGTWNHYGGTMLYKAAPELFPDGLAAFQHQLGLPLITHARWIDPASPYHKKYLISGVAAIDARWWNHIVHYLYRSGVICYEQDWLNEIYRHSPAMASTPGIGKAFTGNMATACEKYGLAMQYCMETPRFLLQGAHYGNLTSVRVATDGFCPDRYNDAIYNDAFARAIGSWPWVDNFRSTETENILIATLTAGPVGVSDALGKESASNIFRAIRADGVIVKPDEPLVPTDQTILNDARHLSRPLIAATFAHQNPRTDYVFICRRDGDRGEFTVTPTSLGISGQCYIYNLRTHNGRVQAATVAISGHLKPAMWKYYELCPITSGMALLGDTAQFVPTGRSRIPHVAISHDTLAIALRFAKGEDTLPLQVYAARMPKVSASMGAISAMRYQDHVASFQVKRTGTSSPETITVTVRAGG
ncbi:MAG: hypothetical protein HKL96_06730 [Phycisphaerales bacterium]|nr:hypothetical protein [Phycisphaerales bacterium]